MEKKAKIKFTPIWNHYDLFKNNDFDKNHFFLTNNVSESINHILNSYFKTKYPTFNEWRNAIVEEIEKVSIKAHEVDRKDYITKILLYLFKLFNTSKKIFKIFKLDEINKINSLIIPEHDSITITSLSQLLNLNFDINNSDNLNSNDNFDNSAEINEEEEEDDVSQDDENEDYDLMNKEKYVLKSGNLFDKINENNNDIFNNFRINIQHCINDINYKNLEKDIDKIILDNKK